MPVLPGYTLRETLHEGLRSVIYRGTRDADGLAVVVKSVRDVRDRQQVAQLRHEHAVVTALDHPGVIKALEIEDYDRRLAVVFEDIGGVALDRLLARRRLALAEFLKIAIQLCSIVEAIHHKNIIHKDINPHNLVYNDVSGVLQLVDFASSSSLPRENPVLTGPGAHVGTIAYMSPEQTGRMNRGVDYRTDFYSMGVTFYEMLTGRRPFTSDDPIELVHAHIAVQPPPPLVADGQLPAPVSAIIMKLLSKRAEDRYQSAHGLRRDLERCLEGVADADALPSFTLGEHDRSEEFRLPQTLYGRSDEIERLLASFERVGQGACELVLVPGYSGIGKSSLVNEIHRPIVARRGNFASGKCDQFHRQSPFSALLQALERLVRQILAEPEDQVARWRERILAAAGAAAGVLVEVLPEIRLLIGPQPPAQELPASEAQMRLLLRLVDLTRTFTEADHPLVLFFDDLQWVDVATLRVLELLVSDVHSHHLLLIGSYRDNEVEPGHPLARTVSALREAGVAITEIRVHPLELADITALVADTLHMPHEDVAPLAEAVFARTRGNPFFARQLLKFLYEEKILDFDLERRTWTWDRQRALEAGDTDNVIDLTRRELRKMPEITRAAMSLAACVGTTFDARMLAQIGREQPDGPRVTGVEQLWEALKRGLVIPVDSTRVLVTDDHFVSGADDDEAPARLRFLHDGVRQAAYAMLDDRERDELHNQIGTFLLRRAEEEGTLDERLFELLGHFNRAPVLVVSSEQRLRLARLNLTAGARTKNSGAYRMALGYLAGGLQFLPDDAFASQYELAVGLSLQKAECEFLDGNFETAEEEFKGLIDRVRTRAEKGRILGMQANLAASLSHHHEAIEIGLRGLELFDIDIPLHPGPEAIGAAIGRVTESLAGRVITSLVDLPPVSDPDKEVIATLYSSIAASAYQVNQQLFPLLVIELVNLSLQHGNTRFSSFGYVVYGIVVTTALRDPEAGRAFALAGIELAHRQGDSMLLARARYLMANFVQHWTRPAAEALKLLEDAFVGCLQSGDLYYAGYTVLALSWRRFTTGARLDALYHENLDNLDFLANRNRDPDILVMTLARHRTVVALTGRDDDLSTWTTYEVDRGAQTTHLAYVHTAAGERAFLLGRADEAREALAQAQELLPFAAGNFLEAECVFYRALALAADYDALNQDEASDARRVMAANVEMLAGWSAWCPENFDPLHALAAAERLRATGEGDPIAEYERAIATAERGGFSHIAALASELAGRYHLARGRRSLARAYLSDAVYGYERWGATAKVDRLSEEFSDLVGVQLERTSRAAAPFGDRVDRLDVQTVIRSANAFAAEIVIDRLLETMMRIIMANAGAERGFLVFERDERWVIDVEASVRSGSARVEVTRAEPRPVTQTDRLSPGIINYVARTREAVILQNASHEQRFSQDPYILRTQPKSLLALPLLYQGKLNGILYLENNLTTDAFTADRVELLNVLSSQAAISIENASLYDTLEQKVSERTALLGERTKQLAEANEEITELNERLAAENVRMEAELDVVQTLQRMLLPHEEELAEVADLEIAGYMSPADEVGGDYYDVLVHDGRVLAAIGDVTGHGLESGVLMLMTQMGVRTLLTSGETDPVRFLDILNRTIYDNVRRIQTEKYLTLALVSYREGVLKLSGLHEELIIVRKDGVVELIDTLPLGLPIGLTGDIADSVAEAVLELDHGDHAILYTDGITEAENLEGERYGLERFKTLLGRNARLSAHALKDAVIKDVHEHIGAQTVYDDITLLIMKRV